MFTSSENKSSPFTYLVKVTVGFISGLPDRESLACSGSCCAGYTGEILVSTRQRVIGSDHYYHD
jgi:hypothetical protein